MKKILVILSVVFVFTSCEKVIELPVNEADQKFVIEAPLSNYAGDSYILLSKTAPIYDENGYEKVSNAQVTVTDKNNIVYTFIEDSIGSGRYIDTTFTVGENNIYRLKVKIGDQEFTSECITQTLTPLNYIFPQRIATTNSTPENPDSTTVIFFSFTDHAYESNFYRFKVYKNGKYTKTLYQGDDKLINGEEFTQVFFGDTFDVGDTVVVEMQNVDEANYDYFYTLSNAQSDNPFSATPANPVTNIKGGALGYFGCYLKDIKALIVF